MCIRDRVLIFAFMLIGSSISIAQTPPMVDTVKYWNYSGNFGVNVNQAAFTNWSKGGENSISGTAFANLFANYSKENWAWENYLLLAYGLMKQGEENKSKKTDDKIEINTKLGYKQWDNLYWTFNANFKTQFYDGYNYPNDSVIISKFMAPAYQILSVGLDYKPNDYLSLYFSPATGRIIFVNDTSLASRYNLKPGETILPSFGWYFTSGFKHDSILTNVSVASKLTLFQNFTDPNRGNRKNIDVDWQTQFLFKINSFMSASLNFQLIYDHDITIEANDGTVGPRTQFMEQIGIGIVYKF